MSASDSTQNPVPGSISTSQSLALSPTPASAAARSPRSPTRSATMPITPSGTPTRVQAPTKTKKDILLPIACRFLPMDQWMTTYVRRSWGVNEAKIILLARCAHPSKPFPPPFIDGFPTQDSQPPLEYSPEPQVLDIPPQGPDAELPASAEPDHSGRQPGPSARPVAESQHAPETLQNSTSPRGLAEEVRTPTSPEAHKGDGDEQSDLSYLRSSPGTRPGSSKSNRSPRRMQGGTMSMSGIDGHFLHSQSSHQADAMRFSPEVSIQSVEPAPPGPIPQRRRNARADPTKQAAYHHYKALLEKTGKTLNADQYILWSYSTGQMIEGHLTLHSACIRPGEMIEIQRKSRHVTLPRPTYAQPYFEVNATVYFAKEKDLDATPVPPSTATFSPVRAFPPPLPLPRTVPPSPAPKFKPKLEARGPTTSRTAHIIELPPHPDEAGPVSHRPSRGESLYHVESLPGPRPPDNEHTPRRKPRRSVSAHFTLGSSRAFDNTKDDERDRWKGKEKETSERRVLEGGLLPPSISDTLFGTALPGIGVASTPDRESAKARKAKKKAEKEARETLEHLRNPGNWKDRVVMVKDGTLWVIKEEAGNSQSPLVYGLSSLLSVEEAGIPEGLNAASHSDDGFKKSIRLRFRVNPQDLYGKSHSTGAAKVVVYVYIHIAQASIHEHLLRVLFCFLKGGTVPPTTPSPVGTSHPPAPIPIATGTATAASRGISPTDQYANSPTSDVLHHRSSVSLSSSFSSINSQSSHGDSDNARPKKKRSLGRLRENLSRKISSEQRSALTGSSNATLQRAMTGSSETLSSSLGSEVLYSQSPTSSPLRERRMSLRTAMKMGPERSEERRIEPPFIVWRERLMKSCIRAGIGEAKLRRTQKGGKSVVHGPWQTDGAGYYHHSFYGSDADDSDPEDVLPALRPVWTPQKRCLNGTIITGEVKSGRAPYSEFEWERWRTDFAFTNARDYDANRYGVPQQAVWSPSATDDAVLYGGRRGSLVPHDDQEGSPAVSSKGKLVKPSPPSLAGPMLTIAGSLIPGRTRSQSVQAMSLRSPTASPGPRVPPEPEFSLASPLTPSSSSSFIPPSPSALFHRPKPAKSQSDFSVSRSRSTTISATSQGGPVAASTISQPPHYAAPSLSTPIPGPYVQTPQPRATRARTEIHEEPESDDSGKSQVSLRSALSLPGQSTSAGLGLVPPSPALSHATTSQVSNRWSQMSEAQMVNAHRIDMGAVMGNTALASARAIATMSGMNPISDAGVRAMQGQPIGLGLGSSHSTSREVSRTSSPAASPAPSVASSMGPEPKRREKFSIAGRIMANRKKPGS
ncbi:hypothetical protein M407DRAFT_26051 [Tulasnella calospora MUT 4182]|uniref:PH domain-containing protein n=1 Tax=Tulasnella calospora MUT 4182 TaxID=1051891 RepID=A0A0C3QGC3_9AGAM|nr:hypothetical protein M407DRAFT_26051 [Tulasnella calospora MUT 4182]